MILVLTLRLTGKSDSQLTKGCYWSLLALFFFSGAEEPKIPSLLFVVILEHVQWLFYVCEVIYLSID